MGNLAMTQMIPIQELTPGQIGAIRNGAIGAVVAMVSRELGLPQDRLVVRDIRPYEDLAVYAQLGTTPVLATVNDWMALATAGSGAWQAFTASSTMADQRYIALFGARDQRLAINHSTVGADVTATIANRQEQARASLIRLTIGGAYKVIWDIRGMQAYSDALVCFSPSPVIIPQNVSYQIHYFNDATTDGTIGIQLIGVVVEPRGLVVSP